MKVTDRDRRVVIKLAAARWLTTTQIAELCFAEVSPEMARRRIRLLREERYVRTVQSNAMAEALHTLGPRGRELLSQERAQRIRLERALPKNMSHLAGINQIRIAVERSARADGVALGFFFACWELQAHGWKLPIIPDAACRVETGARAATVLFEYDRGEERGSYLLQTKFARYTERLAGLPVSRVVIVAETAGLRDRLHAYLGEHLPSPLFSFVAKETLMGAWSVSELLALRPLRGPLYRRNGSLTASVCRSTTWQERRVAFSRMRRRPDGSCRFSMYSLDQNNPPQTNEGRGMLCPEPPREPLGGIQMARRRGQQKGYVHRQGNAWYLAFREDALDSDRKIVRVRRKQKIADAREVTKREAQRIARTILNVIDERAQRPMSLVTVQDFIETRFKTDVIWALKYAGQKHYSYILDKHVLPAMGDVPLRDVNSDHVQALVREKFEAGYSVQTVVHMRNSISAVFNHAKLKGFYQGENPARGVRLPEMQCKETHALSFDQGRELLALMPSPVREMALLSMTASLNVAEMLALRWKRVNLTTASVVAGSEVLQSHTLVVRENYYRGKFGTVKAKSRRRAVPLSTTVVAALAALREGSRFIQPDDLVFASRNGTPLNENNLLRRAIKPIAMKLGLPWLSWHVFRHTHATLGEQIGMALSDRQAQMGHGDVRMTMHYTHSDMERRRAGVEAMSERLTPMATGTMN